MDTRLTQELVEVANRLEVAPEPGTAFVGFDGFVDEITDIVAVRHDPRSYRRIATITDFARRIQEAAGLSTNVELVTTQVKPGGNGPIMSLALARLGVGLTYVGAVGTDQVHPVFDELTKSSRVIGVAEPAYTQAIEFDDGKVMMGKLAPLTEIRWTAIRSRLSVPELCRITGECSLIAALNWTMIPYLTEVWEGFLSEVLPSLPPGHEPLLFFDLCDPAKRETSEIRKAVQTMQQFSAKTRPILGLNRNEATAIAETLELPLAPSPRDAPLEEITRVLGEHLHLHGVVVHPTDQAAASFAGEMTSVAAPYTSRPKLTTGAGDNFNAGFCYGLLLGYEARTCLILGNGTSGFYVRHRRSPNRREFADFLREWSTHVGAEF